MSKRIPKEVSRWMAKVGKLGGSKTSPRKKAASKRNADKAWRARWADRPQRKATRPNDPMGYD